MGLSDEDVGSVKGRGCTLLLYSGASNEQNGEARSSGFRPFWSAASVREITLMLQFPIDDPSHWRSRTDEARKAALKMTDPQAKKTMLVMAANCERLAKLVEERWRNDPD